MSKGKVLQIILLAALAAWVFDIFFGRYLTAKLSTLPIINRWHILTPQAPIVINQREIVRDVSSNDLSSEAAGLQSKLALVVLQGAQASVVGSAVNLTSDGLFVTGNGVLSSGNVYSILMNDGRAAQISTTTVDSAAGLTFFKANISGVPVAPLGNSESLQPGDQLFLLRNSWQNFSYKVFAGIVTSSQQDIAGQVFSSDHPTRTFGATLPQNLISGQAIVNSKGEIIGLWNASSIVSSDVIASELNYYLAGSGNIKKSKFGFSYRYISASESAVATAEQLGFVITGFDDLTSPAKLAGLQIGDYILSLNGNKLDDNNTLEKQLVKTMPGDKVEFVVLRGKNNLTYNVIASQLK